jgi:hypothetical protein
MNDPYDIDEERPSEEEMRRMQDDSEYDREWLRESEMAYEIYP